LTVTVTLTVPDPLAGAVTVSEVALAAVTVPAAAPKLTMLLPGVVLKPRPAIVTTWLTGPELGETVLATGTTTKALPEVAAVLG
jgi:hypothetical protein